MTAVDMGQTSAAEADLKKATDSHDDGVAALAKFALAGLYHQTNRDPQAIETYQQLIPKPTLTVPASMAKLQLASLYEQSKPDEARKLYAEIKDQDKTTAAAQIVTHDSAGRHGAAGSCSCSIKFSSFCGIQRPAKFAGLFVIFARSRQ